MIALLVLLAVAPPEVVPETETETETEPAELEPEPEPMARTGSLVVTLVGVTEPAPFTTALQSHLAPRGIVPFVSVDRDFSPWPAVRPDDRVAEAWIVVPTHGPLRIVVTDPAHEHVLVRTVPHDAGPPSAVTIEEVALIVEESVGMALDGDPWPAPQPAPPVEVSMPRLPEPEPSEPAAPPDAKPPRANDHRGFVIGAGSGIAVVSDEFGDPRVGVPTRLSLGVAFGGFRDKPDLRLSAELAIDRLQVFHPDFDDLSQTQGLGLMRAGVRKYGVWFYGMGGVGGGAFSRRRDGDTATLNAGIVGTLGAGVSVGLTKRFALRVDLAAAGNLNRLGWLGLQLHLESLWGRPREERGS